MPDAAVMTPEALCAFYRLHLPSVYGYLLRLCAGDRAEAEDLTQDVWLALVEELRRGHSDRADVRWLITVARSRFLDHARRERLRRSKLALIRRSDESLEEPTSTEVLDRLAGLQPLHRAVLVLRYVDGMPVGEIAATIGADRHELAARPCQVRTSTRRPRRSR